jgi:quercetin dioxygenase-like cupin family protein
MRQQFAYLVGIAAFTFAVGIAAPHGVGAVATPSTSSQPAIGKEILGQGASAFAPDRVLLLQRRTFPGGSDSGAHPAPGPTVLFVDDGAVQFAVDQGTALLTRGGATASEPIAAGTRVELDKGDAVFYDQGVVHDVANPGPDAAITLEARLNPSETAPATPKP